MSLKIIPYGSGTKSKNAGSITQFLGLNTSYNDELSPPNSFVELENADFHKDGSISPRTGYALDKTIELNPNSIWGNRLW